MKVILLTLCLYGCSNTQAANSRVYRESICDEYIFIDQQANICWLRDSMNNAAIGFQIPCETALKCIK